MKKFMYFLENSFAPKLNKVANNIWIIVIKDSIMQVLPFILLGSLFALLTVPGAFFGWEWYPNFWTPFGWTMGLISLFIAFLVPFNLMEKKRLKKLRLVAALTSVAVFLIIISPQIITDGTIGFGHSALGGAGMFVAIIAGIVTGCIMKLFGNFSFFKEESVMPDFIKSWFDVMLPTFIIITLFWVLVDVMGFDIYNAILTAMSPLGNLLATPYGFVLLVFIDCFLYSMGISTWVLTPIITPIYLMNITGNVELFQTGMANYETLSVVTKPFIFSAYMWIGGTGCTLPLVILLSKSKSKKLKSLGIASLAPSIFNINEPVVFGVIAWNPILMLPMWVIGPILAVITYLFTKIIPFAPIPIRVFEMWYCPFPISTWLTTGSINGILLMLICFVVSSLIWYPFFKVYEKQELRLEQTNNK